MKIPTPNRRKTFLVDPKFQLSFVGLTAGMVLALIGIFAAANHYFFWKLAKKGQELGLPSDHIFFSFIVQQQASMNVVFLISSIVAFILLLGFGIYLSNRIAGPLYRLTTDLRAMVKTGTIRPIKFRDGDYFPQVASAVNELIEKKQP